MPRDNLSDIKRTDPQGSSSVVRDDRRDSLSIFLDGPSLKTNPFGHNLSAEQVYRRAERIAAAAHLITSHISSDEPLRPSIRRECLVLLRHALGLRSGFRALGSEKVRNTQASVRKLISLMRLLGISGYVSSQNITSIVEALDELGNLLVTSQRSVLSEDMSLTRDDLLPHMADVDTLARRHTGRTHLIGEELGTPKKIKVAGTMSGGSLGVIKDIREDKDKISTRSERILDILRLGGLSGIKDIVSNLPSYSEKMIQRELASLVRLNKVRKVGAKRWSRYEIVQ